MAYVVRDSNNNIVATVADNTVDNSTTISLIGKNYVGYGTALNQNLVRMMEHFAKDTQPSNAIPGQIWFDTTTDDLKVYNGSSFVQAIKTVANLSAGNITVTGTISAANIANGNSNVSITPNGSVTIAATSNSTMTITSTGANIAGTANISGNANVGNLGATTVVATTGNIDTVNATTGNITTVNSGLMQNGNSNVTIAANSAVSIAANGAVRMTVDATGNVGIGTTTQATLLDLYNSTAAAIRVQGDSTTHVQAVRSSNDISSPNFILRKNRGTTAAPAAVATGDVMGTFLWQGYGGTTNRSLASIIGVVETYTSDTDISSSIRFSTSTAGGITASEKMRIQADGNIGIGNTAPVHKLSVTGTMNISGNANVGNLGTSGSITALNITANNTGASTALTARSNYTTTPASPDAGIVVSLLNNTYLAGASFGAADLRFLDIGIGPGPQTYLRSAGANGLAIYSGMTVTGSILPSANATYSLGNTTNRWSNIWGLASSAQYADLAEKYRSDSDYAPGTVLEIGGEHEITVCNTPRSDKVFGCVSTDPAYLMNDNNKEGIWLPVVLTGRAPIRVTGPVNKGDRLVSAGNGAAMAAGTFVSSYQTEIGRALETKNTEEIELIEAYISTR